MNEIDQLAKDLLDHNRELSYELLGVIIDVEEGGGFDDICLDTIKRVYVALRDTDVKIPKI